MENGVFLILVHKYLIMQLNKPSNILNNYLIKNLETIIRNFKDILLLKINSLVFLIEKYHLEETEGLLFILIF